MVAEKTLQERIDEIAWYHEFDFGNGLKARSKTPDVAQHRSGWNFIEGELDKVDFAGKSVLDTGCWDGYWSFYAERRGARSVLASDDQTQNWANSSGLTLAKELLKSNVEIDLLRSIYDLQSLNRTFDIVLNLGIYYHLIDPFFSFAQLRHCCHEGSIVVIEGDATQALAFDTMMYDLSDHSRQTFVPTPYVLATMLGGAYFEVVSQTWRTAPAPPFAPLRKRLRRLRDAWKALDPQRKPAWPMVTDRLVTVCRPIEGANRLHAYRPPFGLERYDPRFR